MKNHRGIGIINNSYKTWLDYLDCGLYKGESSFLRFAVLWLSFVCYLNEYCKSNREWNKIDGFIKGEQVGVVYNSLPIQDLIEKFSTATDGDGFVKNMKHGHTNEKDYFDQNHTDVCFFFKAVYQIRCNFFHGDKFPNSERDERIVNWAFESLHAFWLQYINLIEREKDENHT